MTPEIPCAYSGLAMSSASAPPIAALNRATACGGASSKSGLNRGSNPRSPHTVMRCPGGARRAAARHNAALMEAALRLPGSARTFMRQGDGLLTRQRYYRDKNKFIDLLKESIDLSSGSL